MVCRIREIVDFRQVLKADSTADCNKEANEKGQYDTNFPSRIVNLKLDELRNREKEYDEVEEDVDPSVDVC